MAKCKTCASNKHKWAKFKTAKGSYCKKCGIRLSTQITAGNYRERK